MKKPSKTSNFKGTARMANLPVDINVKVDIVNYIEGGICYVTCPALDIIGYGYTEAEARRSFEITLLEYFKYTANKKTLKKDLLDLGWKEAGKNNFIAPSLIDILNKEESLKELLNNIPYQKISRNIEIPIFA